MKCQSIFCNSFRIPLLCKRCMFSGLIEILLPFARVASGRSLALQAYNHLATLTQERETREPKLRKEKRNGSVRKRCKKAGEKK